MEKQSKRIIAKTLSLICMVMLAVVCVNAFGLKPQNAYAACAHQFNGSYQTTWPTCTKKGERVGRCTKCGTVIDRQVLQPTGHKWSSWKVTKSATCTKNGQKKRNCTKCGTTEYGTVYATGHTTNGSYSIKKKATCTDKGIRVLKCTKCQTDLNTQTIPATGHNWVDKQVVQTRTCTQNGVVIQRCTKCSQTRTNTLSALGHTSNGSYTITRNATCVREGERALKCTRSGCGAILNRIPIPKTKHNLYDTYSAGYKTTKCSNCDYVDIEECNEDNYPINGTKTQFKTTGIANGVIFEGEINFQNYYSAQYLKMTNEYIDNALKLSGSEKIAVDNLKTTGIKLRLNSDGTGKAYLKYSSMEDKINQAATDEDLQQSWNFYAYVKIEGNDIILYPSETGNYGYSDDSKTPGESSGHDFFHDVRLKKVK